MSASTFRVEPTPAIAVPKELVHRANAAEVLLADWHRVDDSHFSTTARWPIGHTFFTSVANDSYDPLLVAETMRQLCILLAHTEFGVPLGHQFLLKDLMVSAREEQLFVGDAAALLDVEVRVTEVKRQRDTVTGLRYEAVFFRDGAVAATATGSCTILSPVVYRRVRGDRAFHSSADCRAPQGIDYPPQSVGRVAAMDVALTPADGENHWQLRVDTRHPVFFDHPVDHVPGMLLFEAARQAAAHELGRSSLGLRGIAGEFKQYVELETPCAIQAVRFPQQARHGEEIVLVTGHQNGNLCFSATVTASSDVR